MKAIEDSACPKEIEMYASEPYEVSAGGMDETEQKGACKTTAQTCLDMLKRSETSETNDDK